MYRSLKAVLVAGVLSTTLSAGATPAGGKFDDTHPGWIYSHGWDAVSGPAYSGALNGNSRGIFDGYSSVVERQYFALGGGYYVSPAQNITVTIKALGTKSQASTGYFVDVDYIECY